MIIRTIASAAVGACALVLLLNAGCSKQSSSQAQDEERVGDTVSPTEPVPPAEGDTAAVNTAAVDTGTGRPQQRADSGSVSTSSGPTSSGPGSSGATVDDLGAQGAIAVVRDYYTSIDHHAYDRAYQYWGHDGAASGQSFEEFRKGFAKTASAAVNVGEPGRVEGAAGSRFVNIPVTITAVTTDGTRQIFSGTYSLRRVVIEGASEAERRWHLYSAKIEKVTAGK